MFLVALVASLGGYLCGFSLLWNKSAIRYASLAIFSESGAGLYYLGHNLRANLCKLVTASAQTPF